MNLFTSSFARAGRLPAAVSISRGKPNWYKGRAFDLLAPEWSWVKNIRAGVWSWEKYAEVYNGMLGELDAENVCAALGGGAILLCWCSVPDEDCHRRLAANWIERETGIVVAEWNQQLFFDWK